jgi:tetratricopeptide (TPR) repeat protein
MIFSLGDSQKSIERARKLYEEGKPGRAITTLERALEGNKKDFPVLLQLGKYLFEQNKYVECATHLKKAYHLSPEKWEEIADAIEPSHFSAGAPVETGILLLEIYVDKGMFEEARKIIDETSKDQSDEMKERYLAIYNNVISKKKTEDYKKRDISNIYTLSLLQQKGNLKEGLNIYETLYLNLPTEKEKISKDLEIICRLNYSNAYPRFIKGKLLFYDKKYEEGLKYLRKAVELDKSFLKETTEIMEREAGKSKNPVLLSQLAKYQIAAGNMDKAVTYAKKMENLKDIQLKDIIKLYSQILRKDSKNIDVHFSLAKLYTRNKKFDSALTELSNIIELNPENFEEVTIIAENIIKEDPYNSNLLYFLSELYMEHGENKKAISTLDKLFKSNKGLANEIIDKLNKLLEKNLENLNGLKLLAEIYTYKKEINEALLLYEHLLDLENGFEVAEEGIKEIIEKYPDNMKAKIALALVEFKKGNHKQSLKIIKSVVEENPSAVTKLIPQLDYIARNSPKLAPFVLELYDTVPPELIESFIIFLAKAEAYQLSGEYKKAIKYYIKCYDANPDQINKALSGIKKIIQKEEKFPLAYYTLGELYLKMGKVEEALENFSKANKLDPELSHKTVDIMYKLLKKYPEKIMITQELLKALLHKGAYEQVIAECENAIEKFPKEQTGPIYLLHGEASLEQGLLKQAALSILHVLDIDNTLAEEALKLLNKAHSMDKNNVIVMYGLAKACIAVEKYSDAAFYFYDITKSDPSKIEKSVEELKKISKLDKVNPDVHFSLGSLFLTKKQRKNAVKELRAAAELSDEYTDKVIGKLLYIEKHNPIPEVYLDLGKLYMRKKMYSKATNYLMKAYGTDEKLAEQSATQLNKIIKKDPKNYVVLYALAEIAESENNLEETIRTYKNILDLVPKELKNILKKAEKLVEKHSDNIHVSLFYSGLLILDGKGDESMNILKETAQKQPDKIPEIREAMEEMAKKGNEEAIFAVLEYALQNNEIDKAKSLLNKVVPDFAYHQRIIELLKTYVENNPSNAKITEYLSKFLFMKEKWEEMEEVISRGLASIHEKPVTSLLLLKYLSPRIESEESTKIKSQLVNQMGEPEFYASIKRLKKEKDEFQLRRIRFSREKSPELTSLRLEEAQLLNKVGKADMAIDLLKEPFKQTKNRITAKYITAQSFFLKDNPIRSIEILRTTPLPEESKLRNDILLLLSSSYEKIGDYKAAVAALKSCDVNAEIEQRIKYLNEISIYNDARGYFPIITK